MRNKMKSAFGGKRKGFTLIELVVVMAIIAVLALLVVGAIIVARRTAVRTANNSNATTLQTALEANFAKNGTYVYSGYVAGETFDAAEEKLDVKLGGGGCDNKGGVVSSVSASTYTLTVWDEDCAADDLDNRTVTGP